MWGSKVEANPDENAPENDTENEQAKGAPDGSFAYYQGKPVVFYGGNAYPLPAPVVGAHAGNVTESAEEYNPGAEAESATTAESEGVTHHNV